jgi:multiple sugar transport system ATP-binding protein
MGDRVAIVDRGRLLQVDAPQELYRSPINLFVATFIGSPAMNLVLGRLRPSGDNGVAVEIGSQTVGVPPATIAERPALQGWLDRPIVVGIRPEQLRDPSTGPAGGAGARATLRVTVGLVEPLGAEQLVHFTLAGVEPYEAEVDAPLSAEPETDEEATEPIVRRFVARLDGDAAARQPGDETELAVALDRVHWFDPETGDALVREPALV